MKINVVSFTYEKLFAKENMNMVILCFLNHESSEWVLDNESQSICIKARNFFSLFFNPKAFTRALTLKNYQQVFYEWRNYFDSYSVRVTVRHVECSNICFFGFDFRMKYCFDLLVRLYVQVFFERKPDILRWESYRYALSFNKAQNFIKLK